MISAKSRWIILPVNFVVPSGLGFSSWFLDACVWLLSSSLYMGPPFMQTKRVYIAKQIMWHSNHNVIVDVNVLADVLYVITTTIDLSLDSFAVQYLFVFVLTNLRFAVSYHWNWLRLVGIVCSGYEYNQSCLSSTPSTLFLIVHIRMAFSQLCSMQLWLDQIEFTMASSTRNNFIATICI